MNCSPRLLLLRLPLYQRRSTLYVRWTWKNMPPGAPQAKEGADHVIRLQVSNVAAFPTEELMPPENELKARVDFTYSADEPETDRAIFGPKWASD